METLDFSFDQALFANHLKGGVTLLFENERPLQGLAGLLDWRFQGALSQKLKSGFVTGKEGECTYLPIERNGTVYHLILLGGGPVSSFKKRKALPQSSWEILRKNLISLKLPKLGISLQDFENPPLHEFTKNLGGTSLCIVK